MDHPPAFPVRGYVSLTVSVSPCQSHRLTMSVSSRHVSLVSPCQSRRVSLAVSVSPCQSHRVSFAVSVSPCQSHCLAVSPSRRVSLAVCSCVCIQSIINRSICATALTRKSASFVGTRHVPQEPRLYSPSLECCLYSSMTQSTTQWLRERPYRFGVIGHRQQVFLVSSDCDLIGRLHSTVD